MNNLYKIAVLILVSVVSFSDASANNHDEFQIEVSGMISQSNDTIFVCTGSTLTFITNNNHLIWYNWNFGDGTVWYDSNVLNSSWNPENVPVPHAFTAEGAYTMVVTGENDDNETVNAYAKTIVVIGSPTYTLSTLNTKCFGSCDGRATITITSPNPTFYSVLWNDPAAQTTLVATELCAGPYQATIINSKGCPAIQTTSTAVASPVALTGAVLSQDSVDCNGNSTGSVSVLGSGGMGSYTYAIGPGYQSSGNFTSLAAGAYTVTVKDANACTVTIPVSIAEPLVLTGSIVSQIDADCHGNATGSVSITAAGGTGSFTYNIGSGSQSTGDFNALGAESYVVTVKDANACTYTVPVTITEPAVLTGTIVSQIDVDCHGNSTGAVSITADGGAGSFTYDIGSGFQSTGDFNALSAASYVVTVKDANACTYTIPVAITEPSVLSGSIVSQTDVDCNGNAAGSVSITGSGGTGSFTYDIGSGFQSTGDFNSLGAASYVVTVKDANACTYTIPVAITEPSILSGSIVSQTDVDCNGNATGSLSVTGVGGAGNFTYDIGSGFQSAGDFSSLIAGDYTITVKDANGCIYNLPAAITEFSALTGSIVSQVDIACNGTTTGAVNISAAGGAGSFTFDIGAGAQGSGDFTALNAGDYMVTIKDANDCVVDVPVTLAEPEALNASAVSLVNPLCNGDSNGSFEIQASGGIGPYLFDDGNGPVSLNSFSDLPAGLYTITVSDDNGCALNVDATLAEPEILTASIANGDTIQVCPVNGVQQLNLDIQGGNGGFQSSWSSSPFLTVQSAILAEFDPQQSGLQQTYHVQVTDLNGCTASDSIHIKAIPSTLTGAITIGGVPCTDCEAIEIGENVNPGEWLTINSAVSQANGAFEMTIVPNFTNIILKAKPDNTAHPKTVGYYYPASHKWTNAQIINTGCGLNITKNIDIPAPMNFNGITTLKGHVYQSLPGKAATEDDPIPLIDIIIEKTPPGAAQGMVTTDENGYFEYQYVPASDTVYAFYVNIPGLPLTHTYEFLIGENDVEFSNMDFCVNLAGTEIDTCSTLQLSAVENEEKPAEIIVYPNPSGGDVTVNTGSFVNTASDLRIADLAGRVIISRHYEQIAERITIENLDAGYYFVQIMNGNGNEAKTFQVIR